MPKTSKTISAVPGRSRYHKGINPKPAADLVVGDTSPWWTVFEAPRIRPEGVFVLVQYSDGGVGERVYKSDHAVPILDREEGGSDAN